MAADAEDAKMDEASANVKEQLARLDRENRELRDRMETMPKVPVGPARNATTQSAGCLSLIGLVVVCGVIALSVLWLLSLYPPWQRVRSQRQQVLFWSTWVKDYERQFVGFDYADSEAKKQKDWPATPSGTLFDVTEYQIDWPLLWGEWAVTCGLIAIGAYFAYKRRKMVDGEIQGSRAEPVYGLRCQEAWRKRRDP
jgi:hypothetical protein